LAYITCITVSKLSFDTVIQVDIFPLATTCLPPSNDTVLILCAFSVQVYVVFTVILDLSEFYVEDSIMPWIGGCCCFRTLQRGSRGSAIFTFVSMPLYCYVDC